MASSREVFNVAVIAGQHDRLSREIGGFQNGAHESSQTRQVILRQIVPLQVTNSIGDEVLVQREIMIRGQPGQSFAGYFRRADINVESSLNQESVREIVTDRAALLKIFEQPETNTRRLSRHSRCRNKPRRIVQV
jgi:hypothetical protein